MPTFQSPSIFDHLHQQLGEEVVRAVTTDLSDLNFSRLTASRDELTIAFGTVQEALGAHTIAIPPKFARTSDRLVSTAAGHGYVSDPQLNRNAGGMGLVTSVPGCGLAVTHADAPSLTAVYVPPYGSDCSIAAVSGVWTMLPQGTVNDMMRALRANVGDEIDPNFLWVNIAPGARVHRLDHAGIEKLAAGPDIYQQYISREFTPAPDGQDRPFALDLTAYFRRLIIDEGVPWDQIATDWRDPITARDDNGQPVLPSKRLADATGKPGYSSAIQGIVLL